MICTTTILQRYSDCCICSKFHQMTFKIGVPFNHHQQQQRRWRWRKPRSPIGQTATEAEATTATTSSRGGGRQQQQKRRDRPELSAAPAAEADEVSAPASGGGGRAGGRRWSPPWQRRWARLWMRWSPPWVAVGEVGRRSSSCAGGQWWLPPWRWLFFLQKSKLTKPATFFSGRKEYLLLFQLSAIEMVIFHRRCLGWMFLKEHYPIGNAMLYLKF